MAERLEIKGLRELEAALKKFTPTLQKRGIRRALYAGAQVIRKAAAAKAPERSGVLKRNFGAVVRRINPRLGVQNAYVGVEAGKIPEKNAAGKVEFKRKGKIRLRSLTKREKRGENPYYYIFQELGYTAVGRRKALSGAARRRGVKAVGRKIPGKKFMTNALPRSADAALEKFRATLAAFIDRQKP